MSFRNASPTRSVSYDCYNFEELSTIKLTTDLGFPINLSTHQQDYMFIGFRNASLTRSVSFECNNFEGLFNFQL